MDAREQVSRTVERLGCEHVGKSWWSVLAEALVDEFAPVVAERDQLVAAIRESCEDNRDLMLAEGRTAMCPLAHDLMAERDGLERERWSNMTVGGKRLTWQEAADYHHERAQHEGRLAGVLADLDRCEHGRHEGDDCGSCGGPSHGNPHLQPVMGYDLSATPIVMPADPRDRRNPEAWTDQPRSS